MTRRGFCLAAAQATGVVLLARRTKAESGVGDSPLAGDADGLILREYQPANLEARFSQLADRITPTHQFYVRSHFDTPEIKSKFQCVGTSCPGDRLLKLKSIVESSVRQVYGKTDRCPRFRRGKSGQP